MKLRLTTIYIILLCLVFQVKSQENILPKPISGIQLFPDSIRIEFQDQNAVILFQFRTVNKDIQKLKIFPEQLKTVDKLVRKSLSNLNEPKQIKIVESNQNQWVVEILENQRATKLRVKEDDIEELLPPGWDVNIETSYAHIQMYIHDWEDVSSIIEEDFDQVINSIKSKMDQEFIGRKRTISRSIISDKSLAFNETKFQMPLDMLTINGSFGFGFYRNFYAPELNLSAMVIRNDHFNRPYTQFGLIYENKFFTTQTESGGYVSQTNSFLSLGFSINAYKLDDPFWIGFGGGLLIRNRGDYFDGKTAKFFITTGSKKIKFIPEFYLTNDFKTFSLGAKVSYTF